MSRGAIRRDVHVRHRWDVHDAEETIHAAGDPPDEEPEPPPPRAAPDDQRGTEPHPSLVRANRARLGLGHRRRIGRRSGRCCLQLGRLTHPGRSQRGAALLLAIGSLGDRVACRALVLRERSYLSFAGRL